jgi:phage major head subunit gpT-like protein
MGAQDLSVVSTRDVRDGYFAALERVTAASWLSGVANRFDSDQAAENYPMLSNVPRMREWIGGRQMKPLTGQKLTIYNKHYEATVGVPIPWMRRDKTGQIQTRLDDLAGEGEAHWQTLSTTLILAGPSTVCYDGQYYFDTDHVEGNSGTQSNDITVDISAVPGAGTDNTVTAPNAVQMQYAIVAGISKILGFKDEQGRGMNANARSFLVTVPMGLWIPAVAALSPLRTAALAQNLNPQGLAGLVIDVQMLPELTWTDSFAVWRTDASTKGLILQEETTPDLKILGEDSEHAFKNDEIIVGVDAWRGADYGLWQRACYVTMT